MFNWYATVAIKVLNENLGHAARLARPTIELTAIWIDAAQKLI